jgi:hypothetical protein
LEEDDEDDEDDEEDEEDKDMGEDKIEDERWKEYAE